MTVEILQTDPRASYLAYQTEIDAAVRRVFESGSYILGQEVKAFEEAFAAYVGVEFGIGVANGTDALEIALRACQIGPGDVVLTVSHTAVATVAAIELVGAVPVLVDIDPSSFTIDSTKLEAAVRHVKSRGLGKLKAIVPVHLYGHPCDMPAVMDLAERHGLYVIEDCAQAHGASLYGRKVGTWGHAAAFSLYPTKNLGALGDAGIVVTADAILAERMASLRQYGWRERYISSIPGMNSRLDPVQAAILNVKLKYLDADNSKRQKIAARYREGLAEFPVLLPPCESEVSHVYHQFVLRVNGRDAMLAFLKSRGIGVAIHYPVPVHLQEAYQSRVSTGDEPLLTTEALGREILSLPMHPFLQAQDVETVIAGIAAWFDLISPVSCDKSCQAALG